MVAHPEPARLHASENFLNGFHRWAGGAPLDYVLGIDLGSNSLGWATIRLVDGEPAGLIRAGVRVFEAGMEGDPRLLSNFASLYA